MPTVDVSGLGGIDLTGGLLDPFFLLNLNYSDRGGPITITVYKNGGGATASLLVNAPGNIPTDPSALLTFSFANFTPVGDTMGNIMTNAGALTLMIDASAPAQNGWDMGIDYLQIRGEDPSVIPVPAPLILLGLGLPAPIAVRRRRSTR